MDFKVRGSLGRRRLSWTERLRGFKQLIEKKILIQRLMLAATAVILLLSRQ